MRSLLIVALTTAPAWSAPRRGLPDPPRSRRDAFELPVRHFELGITAFGLVNGSFIPEPDDRDKFVRAPDGREIRPVPYGGFGGVGGGGGMSVIGSWRGFIGVEVQLFRSLDQGASDINETEFTVSQTAWHLPILLRVALPHDVVSPFVYGGPEFVFPGAVEVDAEGGRDDIFADAENYLAWAVGLGAEFKLPGPLDLRIPLQARVVFNPSVGTTVDDLTTSTFNCPAGTNRCALGEKTYLSEWQYQAVAQLGLAWYFL